MFSTYESRKEAYRQKREAEEEEEEEYAQLCEGKRAEQAYYAQLREEQLRAGKFVLSHTEGDTKVYEYGTDSLFTLYVNDSGDCPHIRVESSTETTEIEKEGVILAYLATVGKSTYCDLLTE